MFNREKFQVLDVSFFYRLSVVDFACEEDMKKAIKKLDATELMGRRIRLSEVFQLFVFILHY